MRLEVAAAILAEPDAKRLLKDVIDSVPMLARHGTNQHAHTGGNAITSTVVRGTSSTYLAARIKRDAPEIAARIEDFPSISAAAKAAGIPHQDRIVLGNPETVADRICICRA